MRKNNRPFLNNFTLLELQQKDNKANACSISFTNYKNAIMKLRTVENMRRQRGIKLQFSTIF